MKTDITVKSRSWRGSSILYGIPLLILSLFASQALRAQAACVKTQTFSTPITTGSAAPSWFPDRYAPSGFSVSTASDLLGAGRLKQSLDATTGSLDNRPSGFQTAFYNTQGRKFDLGASANTVQIDLYIDPTWSAAPAKRWAGFWATAFNAANTVSAYPIVEYTTDGGARFRCYDNGSWIDMNSSVASATGWVTMRIKLMPTGQFAYHIQAGANTAYYLTSGYGTSGSTAIGNIILQGHNETSAATNAGYTYDIYWDNFRTEFPGATATVTNNGPVCTGADVTFNITGTPNATVTYNLNGGTSATTTLSAAGASSVVVTAPVADQTLNLLSILNPVTDCAQALSGSSIADVGLGPVTNTTSSNQYCTIQAAIAAATAGDVIQLSAGTYNERVIIDKTITLQGDPAQARANIILDGTGLSGTGSGIFINSGIEDVVLQNLTIRNYSGANGNSNAGIYATAGNNGLEVQNVSVINNPNASGFYANGPVDGITINGSEFSNNGGSARGIVIWNGLKTNITITNNTVNNNNCCGIEMQDGTASGVWIKENTIVANDNAIGLVGATAAPGVSRANVIENNTITVNGRFGIEVKNPDGSGLDTETNGAIIVKGNTVSLGTLPGAEERDLAGISVYRRGVLPGNVDVPTGVVIKDNTVSGFRQASNSTGFGLVIEGTNHTVTNNTFHNNDVALQQQAGHLPYPSDGNQGNVADDYFGRGNSTVVCGNTIASNIFGNIGGANTIETRVVGLNAGGGIVTNTSTNKTFCSIQAAIDDATTTNGQVLEVGIGTYNEQVVINKSLTIKKATGATAQPEINFTGTVTGKATLFDVVADDVVIDDLFFKVDLTKLSSAIIVSGAAIDEITINNNLITPYGAAGTAMAGTYGNRNAVSVNYANYRVATGGVDQINFNNNKITTSAAADTLFRSGLSADEVGGDFVGNTIQTINQDISLRFGSNGDVNLTNNNFNGGGVELAEHNAGAGIFTVANNTFNGTQASTYTSSLRLKNNVNGKQTNVTNNTFTGHAWGISLENYRMVDITNNTFTPATAALAFRHITVNSKLLASTLISSVVRQPIGAVINGNTFNGSATATNGKGIAFYNHWKAATAGAEYGDFTVGIPSAKNTFNEGITNYIFIDSINNQASTSLTANYPEYTGLPATTTGFWTMNINGANNNYVASAGGTAKEYANMNFTERYDYLYGHIFDKVDRPAIGRVVFATPVHNITQTIDYATIQDAVDAANANDVIVTDPGYYVENITVNKSVTINGPNAGVAGTNATRSAEAILKPYNFNANLWSITGNNTVIIDGFEIDSVERLGSVTANNVTIKNNVYKNVVYPTSTVTRLLVFSSNNINFEHNKLTLGTGNPSGKNLFYVDGNSTQLNLHHNEFSIVPGTTGGRPVILNISGDVPSAIVEENLFQDVSNGVLLVSKVGRVNNRQIRFNTFNNMLASSIYLWEGLKDLSPTSDVVIEHNLFDNGVRGILSTAALGASNLPPTSMLKIQQNSFQNLAVDSSVVIRDGLAGTLDLSCNWWGTANHIDIDNSITVPATVTTLTGTFLNDGTNTATGLGFATAGECIGRVHNITQNTWYPTIQTAIDHASTVSGDVIEASAGTYRENVLVNKSVTIQGVGNTTKVVSVTPNGNTVTVDANAVTIKNMEVQGLPDGLGNSATRGIYFNTSVSNTIIENVLATQHQFAIHADNAANVNGLTIVNPELSHSGNGLQVEASAKIAKLYINGGSIHDNQYGLSSTATIGVSNTDGLQNVSVTGVTFSNNLVKGMYFEKLDSANIAANTFSNNGSSTASPSALDINLKSGNYTNIVVLDNILNNNSIGSATGTGIAVKARNDGAIYSANPASLTNVFVNNNEITGTPIGLSIGYDVAASSIANNLITGAAKGVVVYGMPANYTTTLLSNSITATTATIENANVATSPVVATCNWFGNTTDATIAASIIENVSYNPWLISGTDAATATTGFQPSVPCASRPTAVITPTTTTICAGSPATLSIALTGLAPWTVTYSDGTTPVTITGVTTSPLEVVVTPTANTTYTVTALNDANYPALAEDMTGTANVIVTPIPTAAIAYSSSPFCKTSTAELVTLTGTNAYTGGAFTSTTGLTIDGTTGEINPSTSIAGTYTVTYTTLASGGCAAVDAVASVEVKELVTATVSAPTAPIILNSSTTSTVTFTGNGGEAPYTFRYRINGVLQPAITSSSTSNVVTVAHPNTAVGTFTYLLDSVRDASGCYGEVSTLPAVVSVVAPDNSVDLRAFTIMNDNSFALPGELTNSATINLYNLGAVGSVTIGVITLYVYIPTGVSLVLPSGSQWTLTAQGSYYELSSSIQINQGSSAFVPIDFEINVPASMGKGYYSLPIEIAEGAGSEGLSNSNNNFSSILINVTQ